MRQGQHKNRSRNRGRRPGSSVNRVYESNGPDVKVRGTAQTVADKYLQLARDATVSGDIIKAESFYQYAEHYLRIVAASQPFMQQGQQSQQRRSMYDDDGYDDGDEPSGDAETQADETQGERDAEAEREALPARSEPVAYQPQPQPQPRSQPQPREAGAGDGGTMWDGPQPDFLKKTPQPNGSAGGRPRRDRRPRPKPTETPAAPAGGDQPQVAAGEDDGDGVGGNV